MDHRHLLTCKTHAIAGTSTGESSRCWPTPPPDRLRIYSCDRGRQYWLCDLCDQHRSRNKAMRDISPVPALLAGRRNRGDLSVNGASSYISNCCPRSIGVDSNMLAMHHYSAWLCQWYCRTSWRYGRHQASLVPRPRLFWTRTGNHFW